MPALHLRNSYRKDYLHKKGTGRDRMIINGKTRTLGLLGDPVEHTLSPLIHNTLSEKLEYNNVYVPFHTKSEDLQNAVAGAFALNILGLNVTVPHKSAVMQYLCAIDEGGKAIGAVNTLVRTEHGYKGYNTDMMGLLRAICSYGIELSGRNVVILGAGGAAKAVSYMCVANGANHVYILNRTVQKAEEIADNMNAFFGKTAMTAMDIQDYKKLPKDKYIVFQSTSKGLYPKSDEVIIEDEAFYSLVDVGVDLIYKPFCTTFMSLCKKAGAEAYNGLKMLLYQGIIAYELWNDISVDEKTADEIYEKLLKQSRENIILTGFMGSGKTTTGLALAEQYGYTFLDTDKYIEEKQGCTIAELFEKHGEAYFRQLETDALKELNATLTHAVLSTGGGLPLKEENAAELSKLGTVVYLKITPEEVLKRLSGDSSRPLLAGGNPEQNVRTLLAYREPLYEKGADCIVEVSGKTTADIVKEILARQQPIS